VRVTVLHPHNNKRNQGQLHGWNVAIPVPEESGWNASLSNIPLSFFLFDSSPVLPYKGLLLYSSQGDCYSPSLINENVPFLKDSCTYFLHEILNCTPFFSTISWYPIVLVATILSHRFNSRPATGDKDIPTGQALPNPDDARPIVGRPHDLPVATGYDRAWARTQSL
jgi:hypothetical protein